MTTSPSKPSAIDRLEQACSSTWANITASRTRSTEELAKIEGVLSAERLVPADTCPVIFGSLARGEFTEGSDVDWTLLIDGQVDDAHLTVAQEIAVRLETLNYKRPSPA